MNNIQIVFDLATSLSVIGATILIIKSLVTQNKKNRLVAISKLRIENMVAIINEFTKLIEKGEIIAQEVREMECGKEGTVTVDTYTNHCFDTVRYLRRNLKLRYQVWGTDQEIRIFRAIEDHIRLWNSHFMSVAYNGDKKTFRILEN